MKTSAPHRSPKLRNALLAFTIAGFAVGAWVTVRHAHQSPGHHHENETAAVLALNDGRRWETDLPLRTGMQRIRQAVDEAFTARAAGRFTAAEAKALSVTMQENVNYLIANCKLPPKADATLHVLIGELLAAAGQLVENPAAHAAWDRTGQALRRYAEHFDHPGWIAFETPKS
jgi:hypothetical protein